MSLTAEQVIQAARDRHPAFSDKAAPPTLLLRHLTDYQRTLVGKGLMRNPDFLAQQVTIFMALGAENSQHAVSAGGPGGLPARGGVLAVDAGAGSAVEFLLDDATVLVADFVPGAVTATTVTKTGAAWVVNAYANKYLYVKFGPGGGQLRKVDSNTVDTLVFSVEWEQLPTIYTDEFEPGSVLAVYDVAPSVTTPQGVVTAVPSVEVAQGYLVRLSSTGQPYIDVTQPILVDFAAGCPLPPHQGQLLGATAMYAETALQAQSPVDILDYAHRFDAERRSLAVYELSGALFLMGDQLEWQDVEGLDVRYAPVPPALTEKTDLLLLPDHASETLAAELALFIGRRLEGTTIPAGVVNRLERTYEAAEDSFLGTVAGVGQARPNRIQSIY